LIYYSISSYELLERKLSDAEKEEIYLVFYRMGMRMHIESLPDSYVEWLLARERHLDEDLEKGACTEDLFRQYRKHLGPIRYFLLREVQKMVCPPKVIKMLGFGPLLIYSILVFYKWSRLIRLDGLMKSLLLPMKYKKEIRAIDRPL